jgi:hypothetical protein
MNLAPNGKKSNLTNEQYKLVRTKAFKKWFGDWENAPETASKVIDENGEPLVVFHGTKKEFNDFTMQENTSNPYLLGNDNGIGFFFTNDIDSAEKYARIRIVDGEKKIPNNSRVIKAFLNIRSPYNFNFSKYAEFTKQVNNGKLMKEQVEALGYDGIVIENNYSIIVFSPEQIKLAESNTTFDGGNPDIRFEDGGSIDKNCIDYIKKTESILKNGYYHCFGSLCFITYNSGNQKDLNVYQTVNLLLSKSLSELLKIDEESASNLISNYYDNARRFDTLNIIKELKGCNIIIADRHKIVCANNIDNVATRYKKVGNMETEYKVIFESRSGSGNVREVRVSASNFNDAKKKGWIKSGLNKKFYAFLTAHEIKAVGGIMASMQVLSTGYTLHNNVQPYKYTIGGL